MRRILCLLLVLSLGLEPLCALLPGQAEQSLPPCCRRHGAHHCAKMQRFLSRSSDPAFAAPLRCPLYPAVVAPAARPEFTSAPPSEFLQFRPNGTRLNSSAGAHPLDTRLRACSGRGPPALALA